MAKALQCYEDYNRLEKELFEAFPNNVEIKNNLAISYTKLGKLSRDGFQDSDQAKQYFRQAEQLWVELVVTAPQYVQFQHSLEWVRQQLAS